LIYKKKKKKKQSNEGRGVSGEYFENAPDACQAGYDLTIASAANIFSAVVANVTAYNATLGASLNASLYHILEPVGMPGDDTVANSSDLSFIGVCSIALTYFYDADFNGGIGPIAGETLANILASLPADQLSAVNAELAQIDQDYTAELLNSTLLDLYACFFCNNDYNYYDDNNDDYYDFYEYVAPTTNNNSFCSSVGEYVRVSTLLAILNKGLDELSGGGGGGGGSSSDKNEINVAIANALQFDTLNATLNSAATHSLKLDAVCATLNSILTNSAVGGDEVAYVGVYDLLYELIRKVGDVDVTFDLDKLLTVNQEAYEALYYSVLGDLLSCVPCADLFVNFISTKVNAASSSGNSTASDSFAISQQQQRSDNIN
jgi:hypothetical protein